MLIGRTRCLSWEQEGLHLTYQKEQGDSDATGPIAPTAPLPPPELAPLRADKVAQLQAYLADLRGCRKLPETFPTLVRCALEQQRGTGAIERGKSMHRFQCASAAATRHRAAVEALRPRS